MDNLIMVSVLCLAYNHEKYIRQCLNGFVIQNTSFPFEVLIHDDASTDRTADIIREYEARYPDIIKPVYQAENQHSKHVPIFKNFLLPKAQGKYIALCEGDDCWLDPMKLQKQVDALETYSECKMSVCKVKIIEEDGSETGSCYPSKEVAPGILDSKQFLEAAMKYYFHTSSYVMEKNLYAQFITEPPIFRQVADVGDQPLLLYFGSIGPVYYIGDSMSCYRRNAAGSWTVRTHSNHDILVQHSEHMIQMVAEFDKYTNYVYHDICEQRRSDYELYHVCLKRDFKAFFQMTRQDTYRQKPIQKKAIAWMRILFPGLVPKVTQLYSDINRLIASRR